MIGSAVMAAEHPNLEFVQFVGFGRGHDAYLSDGIIRVMKEIPGKSPRVLKMDESDVQGPLRIRVRSFLQIARMKRAEQKNRSIKYARAAQSEIHERRRAQKNRACAEHFACVQQDHGGSDGDARHGNRSPPRRARERDSAWEKIRAQRHLLSGEVLTHSKAESTTTRRWWSARENTVATAASRPTSSCCGRLWTMWISIASIRASASICSPR